jgi:hypothetical protein
MRFVLVNGRTPFRQTFCLQCCEKITSSYVREIGTQLPYCGYECYALHREYAPLADNRDIRARAAS